MTYPQYIGFIRIALLLILFKGGKLDSPKFYSLRFKENKDKLLEKTKEWTSLYYKPMAVEIKTYELLKSFEAEEGISGTTLKSMIKPPYAYRFYINLALNFI